MTIRAIVVACVVLATAVAYADYRHVELPNGDVYEGDVEHDLRNGQGTYTWADGNRYVGQYRGRSNAGHRHLLLARRSERTKAASRRTCGKAAVCCGGPTAIGTKVNSWKTTLRDAASSSGPTPIDTKAISSAASAPGRERIPGTTANATKARSRDDQLQGLGKFFWPDGRKYEGSFVAGKKSGTGTFEWPNGNRYVGAFANDAREGLGDILLARRHGV